MPDIEDYELYEEELLKEDLDFKNKSDPRVKSKINSKKMKEGSNG